MDEGLGLNMAFKPPQYAASLHTRRGERDGMGGGGARWIVYV